MLRQNRDGGYLLIDHRFSPGIPEDVAQKIGMPAPLVGEGKILEAATLTCAHCKTAVMKNPLRVRERENCPKCGFHYICDFCAAEMRQPDYSHTPYDAQLAANADRIAKGLVQQGSPPKLILPDECL